MAFSTMDLFSPDGFESGFTVFKKMSPDDSLKTTKTDADLDEEQSDSADSTYTRKTSDSPPSEIKDEPVAPRNDLSNNSLTEEPDAGISTDAYIQNQQPQYPVPNETLSPTQQLGRIICWILAAIAAAPAMSNSMMTLTGKSPSALADWKNFSADKTNLVLWGLGLTFCMPCSGAINFFQAYQYTAKSIENLKSSFSHPLQNPGKALGNLFVVGLPSLATAVSVAAIGYKSFEWIPKNWGAARDFICGGNAAISFFYAFVTRFRGWRSFITNIMDQFNPDDQFQEKLITALRSTTLDPTKKEQFNLILENLRNTPTDSMEEKVYDFLKDQNTINLLSTIPKNKSVINKLGSLVNLLLAAGPTTAGLLIFTVKFIDGIAILYPPYKEQPGYMQWIPGGIGGLTTAALYFTNAMTFFPLLIDSWRRNHLQLSRKQVALLTFLTLLACGNMFVVGEGVTNSDNILSSFLPHTTETLLAYLALPLCGGLGSTVMNGNTNLEEYSRKPTEKLNEITAEDILFYLEKKKLKKASLPPADPELKSPSHQTRRGSFVDDYTPRNKNQKKLLVNDKKQAEVLRQLYYSQNKENPHSLFHLKEREVENKEGPEERPNRRCKFSCIIL